MELLVRAFVRLHWRWERANEVPARARRRSRVLGAVLAFGWLLERFGLVAAVAALASVSALAQEDRRPWEVPALIGALSLIAWLVFVRGLDLPIPLWPGSGGA